MVKIKSKKYLTRISFLIFFIWSTIIVISTILNTQIQEETTNKIVLSIAYSNFNKDLAYRKWAAKHGGVYVSPSEETPPNPYLAHIKDRDVVTTSGKKLTLMNPAYMLREMMHDYSKLYGIKGRITGIVYLNPNNKADEWETKAIKKFAKGIKEVIEITGSGENEKLRLMKPMIMQEECKKCHGHLGFKNGSVRGGISVSIPMIKYRLQEEKSIKSIKSTAFVIWLIGFLSIIFVSRYILNHIKQRENELDKLIISDKILNTMLDLLFITNIKGKIVRVNKAFEEITGYTEQEVIGQKASILKAYEHDDKLCKTIWENLHKYGKYSCEVINKKKNGEIFITIENITSVKNKSGEIRYFICIMHDITKRKNAEKKITHMAHYDALTNLPNRILYQIRFEHALEIAKRNSSKVVLIYLDIDDFKIVNDTLGHQIGDKLLQKVATILTNTTRQSDTVSRLGGDEFTIIFENLNKIEEIIPIIEKILTNLKQTIIIDNHPIHISGSIGASIYPDNGENIEALVKCADIAMYHCKHVGKNRFHFYNDLPKTF